MRRHTRADVKCPFFRRERETEIRCDGGSRVRMTRKTSIDRWLSIYCCDIDGWRRCAVARCLRLEYGEAEAMNEDEVRKWKDRAVDKQKQIKRLRAELEEAHKGVRQMSRSVDSILAVACRTLGKETKPGTWALRLPEIRIEETLKDYAIFAEKDAETGEYVVTCARRKP